MAQSRILLFIVVVCGTVAGCDRFGGKTGPNQQISRGRDRLLLTWHAAQQARSYDSPELKWETNGPSGWQTKLTITSEDFRNPTGPERWVAELRSFDPRKGRATLKVAEAERSTNWQVTTYAYSWREWDLLTNGQVRIIRACKYPSEDY